MWAWLRINEMSVGELQPQEFESLFRPFDPHERPPEFAEALPALHGLHGLDGLDERGGRWSTVRERERGGGRDREAGGGEEDGAGLGVN